MIEGVALVSAPSGVSFKSGGKGHVSRLHVRTHCIHNMCHTLVFRCEFKFIVSVQQGDCDTNGAVWHGLAVAKWILDWSLVSTTSSPLNTYLVLVA